MVADKFTEVTLHNVSFSIAFQLGFGGFVIFIKC